jgi:hypothetical protein
MEAPMDPLEFCAKARVARCAKARVLREKARATHDQEVRGL